MAVPSYMDTEPLDCTKVANEIDYLSKKKADYQRLKTLAQNSSDSVRLIITLEESEEKNNFELDQYENLTTICQVEWNNASREESK
jgi:hypothetical protein